MSDVDLAAFAVPIAGGPAGGVNCEYDPTFQSLERLFAPRSESMVASEGEAGDERDWRAGRDAGLDVLARSRDLRAACRLCVCLLHTDGLEGFAGGLELAAAHVGPLWDGAHPLLDADDGYDPTARCNAFAILSDPETVRALERTPLAVNRMRMTADVRLCQVASGRRAAAGDEEAASAAGLVADAFVDDAEAAAARLAAARRAQAAIAEIDARWRERMNALAEWSRTEDGAKGRRNDFTQAPRLDAIDAALAQIVREMSDRLEGPSSAADAGAHALNGALAPSPVPGAAPAASTGGAGAIASRADARRELARVADWFRSNEPSSPVPLLIERARMMIDRPFLEIVADLGSDGLEELKKAIDASEA